MKLRKCEAEVLELLKQGKTPNEIAKILGKTRGAVVNLVVRLHGLGVVERAGKGKYTCLIETYQVAPDGEVMHSRSGIRLNIDLPDGYKDYIRGHYRKVPRHELARRLGMSKTTLNFVLLQMGCGQ